jgi:hypothetical protein
MELATPPEHKRFNAADETFAEIVEFEHADKAPDSPLVVVLGIGAGLAILFAVLWLVPPLVHGPK